MESNNMKAASVVHFIGVGAMGGPMAQRLLEGGHTVRVFDTNAQRVEAFSAQHGKQAALTADQLGAGADYVVMILPNSGVVEEVLFGKNGLVKRLKKNTMIICLRKQNLTMNIGNILLLKRNLKLYVKVLLVN
jgi:3-hydroxyisobutyrate dehydrogenase